jgi:hypothetical protein
MRIIHKNFGYLEQPILLWLVNKKSCYQYIQHPLMAQLPGINPLQIRLQNTFESLCIAL